jgi:hypothetical protein
MVHPAGFCRFTLFQIIEETLFIFMKYLKRIIFFAAILASYFIVKEFLQLYFYISSINQVLGYLFILILVGFLSYYVIVPLYSILRAPVSPGPAKNRKEVQKLIELRMKNFQNNSLIKEANIDISEPTEDNYNRAVEILSAECEKVRKKYVNQMFYSTAISQNGFLDAIIILSSSVNMIKEIFTVYNGRVANRELIIIGKKVYYSVIIGGSEGVEYATEEIFSKFSTDMMKNLPFLNRVLSSLADGFVNSVLLTRVSLITENYCKLLYIESDKDLYPSPKVAFTTAKDIVWDVVSNVKENLTSMAKSRSELLLEKTYVPISSLLDKSYETLKKSKPSQFGSGIIKRLFGSSK